MKNRALIRHHTERVVRNRKKQWEIFRGHGSIEAHKFHKRKPFDCGNTQCALCRDNWRKSEFKHKPDWVEEDAA